MILPSSWELPESIRIRFGKKSAGRQRAMYHEGHLLLILHLIPGPDTPEREAVFFWRNPEEEWKFSGRGPGFGSLQNHLEDFEDIEEEFRKEYSAARDAEDYFELLEKIAPVHRTSKGLHSTLQSAREQVRQDKEIITLRDRAYEIERELELLYRDAENALNFQIAKQAEAQAKSGEAAARSGRRLNILAALFFPITALAGIFGMNLHSGIERMHPAVFWVILVFGIILGFALRSWVQSVPRRKLTASALLQRPVCRR
jgi:hypothetical protein